MTTVSRTTVGVVLGALAGVLDVIPMIVQGLSWDANTSAFLLWVINGFFYFNIRTQNKPSPKGRTDILPSPAAVRSPHRMESAH